MFDEKIINENVIKSLINYLKKSNDKDILIYCENDFFSNYELIKFIIENYKDDLALINKYVLKYLNSNHVDTKHYYEIVMIMDELTKDTNYNIIYDMLAKVFYSKITKAVKNIKNNPNSLGFLFVLKHYDIDIIKEKIALNMLNDIFYDFNKLKKSLVKSFEKSDYFDITNFINEYIWEHDNHLAYYSKQNSHLLIEYKKYIEVLIKDKDELINDFYQERSNFLIDEIESFISIVQPNFDCYKIVENLFIEFNIHDIYKMNFNYNEEKNMKSDANNILERSFQQHMSKMIKELFIEKINYDNSKQKKY